MLKDTVTINKVLSDAIDHLEKSYAQNNENTRLTTSIESFDTITSGLPRSGLFVIASRPSMGKKALALNLIERISNTRDSKVVIYGQGTATLYYAYFYLKLKSKLHHLGNLSSSDWPKLSRAFKNLINNEGADPDNTKICII